MSVLDVFDATRVCARLSPSLADPGVWVAAAPVAIRREVRSRRPTPFSWWALARNPHALALSGMVGAAVATDHVRRLVTGTPAPRR